MGATAEQIKELREFTSCGIMDCKNALEEAKGDFEKAKDILKRRGLEIAAKKSSRVAKEGRVESYVHFGNKIAVLVEVNCETDFVARNEDFARFTKDLAMHIAAAKPIYISEKDIPEDVLAKQEKKEIFVKEKCLLHQPFIKDLSMTIQDYLNTIIAKIGENIIIGRFARFQVGVNE